MAIVNGFDTNKLKMAMCGCKRYEIYKENDFYYLTNGYVMVKCGFDVVAKTLVNLPELKIPNNGYGYMFTDEDGWSDSSISMLHKYFEYVNSNHRVYQERFHNVKEFKQIQHEERRDGYVYSYPCIVCELDNGEKVLLNKKYADVLAKAKKWDCFAECKDCLSCVHFMNKQNILEAWICPIRYKEGAI